MIKATHAPTSRTTNPISASGRLVAVRRRRHDAFSCSTVNHETRFKAHREKKTARRLLSFVIAAPGYNRRSFTPTFYLSKALFLSCSECDDMAFIAPLPPPPPKCSESKCEECFVHALNFYHFSLEHDLFLCATC